MVKAGRAAIGHADALETTMRLAVLLGAGLTPARAWAVVAERGEATAVGAARAAARGDDVAEVLRSAGETWSDVAAVYAVAVDAGAPLADTLRTIGGALRDAAEISADVRVALAEPAATARLLAWLPVLGVPLGLALGFDTVGILVTDPLGTACLFGGALLVVASRLWARHLVRRARPPRGVPGLNAELWAVALSAGISVDRARQLATAAGRVEPPPSETSGDQAIEATLELAVRAGVPASELLRGDAWMARHRARTEGRAAAARLSTHLLVPLGACTLPAFLLLAVVPMMLGLLRSSGFP
ncbi:type II secretion system F family protein [Microbacterium sp. BH-3-3-3]|uniref:type II secretion system F family protein n=1 Tax=Microbacterium sp. BH-3-3-3 TaxID=1906742 RepID=UPI0008929568|nr:type II secretion system F family protein [Microbacterium sp. BH-3-3-3]AOX46716.1 hypothetical protein BJP65_13690 [Microbacterium sp. BH-3-3-3]